MHGSDNIDVDRRFRSEREATVGNGVVGGRSMETMERTSKEVYIDRIGGQHRQECNGDRIWLCVIKRNHWATGDNVAVAHNQQRGNYALVW